MRTRRGLYGLRAFVPGLRVRHRLEAMVGPLGYWNELQRYQFELLKGQGLEPTHRLLDIGCGPLQGGVPLIGYLDAGHYTGVDSNPDSCEMARRQVARHGLGSKVPRIIHSASLGDDELGNASFDMIWASQVVYYFGDSVMGRLLRMVRARLRPGGVFLFDTFSPDHYEFTHPEHPGKYVRHTLESLAGHAQGHGLVVRKLGIIHDFGYPRRLSLGSNPLFAVTHTVRAAGQ